MSSCVNDVSDGSPSRIRIVLRISFGMTTRPRSSMRLTIPVAFIGQFSLVLQILAVLAAWLLSAYYLKLCLTELSHELKNTKKHCTLNSAF